MNRHDGVSVKWRLFFYLVIFTAILLVLLWFFQIVFLDRFYTSIKTQDVKFAAKTIANNIDNEDLSLLIESLTRQNGMSASIVTPNGAVLYTSDFNRESRIADLQPAVAAAYYSNVSEQGGTALEVFENAAFPSTLDPQSFVGNIKPPSFRAGQSIMYATIVSSEANGDVMILLNSVITPVDATVQTLQVQLIYITIIMLAFSLLLAFLMAKRISRPIIQTTASARKLAKGEYNTVFDAHGYREIAELNSTLNYAASELSKVETLRRELIANISHDLRTPLTMIAGYAEVMRDIPGETTPQNLQIIIDETNRLNGLVSDILDLSKLQAGVAQIHADLFNLTACIRDILLRYGKLTGQDGYRIHFMEDEDIWVNADSVRISQVVYNLINNAINYTGNDKTVTIRQTAQNGIVRIEVVDSGAGIADADLDYIWDQYYKVDKSHRRATVGSGLGLSIVRSILNAHGSACGVVSTLGQGSTFWFELPVVPAPQP